MKVLWICNFMLPAIAKKQGVKATNKEGWLAGLSDRIMTCTKTRDLSLILCFPVLPGQELVEGSVTYPQESGESRSLSYYAYPEEFAALEEYQPETETRMLEILQKETPDVIHIFGTEFPHALATMRAAKSLGMESKILIGIQGYMTECAKHYYADLPEYVIKRRTFRDWLKKDSIIQQKEKFELRASMERDLLKDAIHITGRTDFDHGTIEYNKTKANYHFMNETLRSNFYEGAWKQEDCEPFEIFVSQGNYPLKGAHKVLQAVGELKEEFPGMHVSIAGDKITALATIKDKIKISSYGKYLLELVEKYGLEDMVTFTGSLSAEDMKKQYLKSFVFISSSSIENSPNSVGEAMLLGMPVITSDVGGVRSLFSEEEGYLYPFEDVEALKERIRWVFHNRKEAIAKGRVAMERARRTHNPDTNFARLLEIYEEIK